jgi:hypothetical protein
VPGRSALFGAADRRRPLIDSRELRIRVRPIEDEIVGFEPSEGLVRG